MQNPPSAIITGASSGLGWEFARQLAALGQHSLILTARRKERLEELQAELAPKLEPLGLKVHVFAYDLTKEDDRAKFVEEVNALSTPVALLINNAGFGSLGSFERSTLSWELDMIRLNCEATVHLTHAFLPGMRERKAGAIVNVASTASFQAMPFMATYGATKAFLLQWSLALGEELKPSGVLVQALCPGPTKTEFHLVVGLPEKLSYLPSMSATTVIEECLSGIKRQRRLVVNGGLNRFLAQLNRLLPRTFVTVLVRKTLQAHR